MAAQYEMSTGEPLELFLDQTSIAWGDDWRKKVDDYLESAVFFVPVITPRYLNSPECRREFRHFAQRSEALGMSELILSLHYVNVPALNSETPSDEIVQLVRRFQWMDWRDVRFQEIHSAEYRRAVNEIVERLIAANKQVEQRRKLETPGASSATIPREESLGFIDRLANMEETMPKWNRTMESIAEEIEIVGQTMREGSKMVTNRPASRAEFGYRKAVARQLAQRLEAPAARILEKGNDFAAQLHTVDDGIRTLIDLGTKEAKEGGKDEREALCKFFGTVRGLASTISESLEEVKNMVGILFNLQNLSRDLRPVLRRLSRGLTAMVEAREVTDEWVMLIERSGVECPE